MLYIEVYVNKKKYMYIFGVGVQHPLSPLYVFQPRSSLQPKV